MGDKAAGSTLIAVLSVNIWQVHLIPSGQRPPACSVCNGEIVFQVVREILFVISVWSCFQTQARVLSPHTFWSQPSLGLTQQCQSQEVESPLYPPGQEHKQELGCSNA